LNADAIAADVNLDAPAAIAAARAAIARLPSIPRHQGPMDLDVNLRVIHGRELVASTEGATLEDACGRFEAWIGEG
jgi:hypothetical protein